MGEHRELLADSDPALAEVAAHELDRLRAALAEPSWTYDHIGSTSVPGLRAKPIVDLQLGVRPLPPEGSPFDETLLALGYRPSTGSRPDSPGVYRDMVREPGLAPEAAYRKRLYVGERVILHVRLLGSPWWSYTVLFRDWLRADAEGRAAYQRTKEELAARYAGAPDYDDYTRAKTAFFDEVQRRFEEFGADSPYRVRRVPL